ncbi:MAG: hypothetical protein NVSMB38_22160 [Ktedonobacteraceae bacterium]
MNIQHYLLLLYPCAWRERYEDEVLALLVAFFLLTAVLTCIFTVATVGNLNALSALTPAFWSNTGICLLAVVMSMGITILLAVAMNALFGYAFAFVVIAYIPTWKRDIKE